MNRKMFANTRRFLMTPGLFMFIAGLGRLNNKADLICAALLIAGIILILTGITVLKGYISEYWDKHHICKKVTCFTAVIIVLGILELVAGGGRHAFDAVIIIFFSLIVLVPLNFFMWLFAALNDDLSDIIYIKNKINYIINKREEENQ